MAVNKACKHCRKIYTGAKCPNCESEEGNNNYKGRIVVFNPEKSEIAKNLGLKKKGEYAIKS